MLLVTFFVKTEETKHLCIYMHSASSQYRKESVIIYIKVNNTRCIHEFLFLRKYAAVFEMIPHNERTIQ